MSRRARGNSFAAIVLHVHVGHDRADQRRQSAANRAAAHERSLAALSLRQQGHDRRLRRPSRCRRLQQVHDQRRHARALPDVHGRRHSRRRRPRQSRHPRERRRRQRHHAGRQTRGRLHRQIAGRGRRFLLHRLSEEPRIRERRAARSRRHPSRLAEEHLGHRRFRRRPRAIRVLAAIQAALSRRGRPLSPEGQARLAVPDERHRQIRQKRRVPEGHVLRRRLHAR